MRNFSSAAAAAITALGCRRCRHDRRSGGLRPPAPGQLSDRGWTQPLPFGYFACHPFGE